jgi:3-oxoacyl-[acyl-carrier protein] reductase
MNGRRAVVVGGGSGIGEATCRQLAEAGASVAVIDILGERASRVASDLPGAVGLECDARDSGAVDTCMQSIVREFGGIDFLVNTISAPPDDAKQHALATLGRLAQEQGGLVPAQPTFSAILEMSDDAWNAELNNVLTPVFYCTRAALREMIPQKYGSIVSLSSIHALSGYPGFPHYSAAKAGIVGFTRAAAREVGPHNVRVNAVTAGYVLTPMSEKAMPDSFKRVQAQNAALGRMGTADEVAAVVVFLCSDSSAFITGQAISPNGGYLTVAS